MCRNEAFVGVFFLKGQKRVPQSAVLARRALQLEDCLSLLVFKEKYSGKSVRALPQGFVEGGFLIGALRALADNESARDIILTRRKLFFTCARNHH